MSHEQFKAIARTLTASLASAFEAKLIEMGDDVKGISWFSSSAEDHVKNH